LRFICAFDGGGFFLLLVVSVSIDVGWGLSLVRISGCAEAKPIGDDIEVAEMMKVDIKKAVGSAASTN